MSKCFAVGFHFDREVHRLLVAIGINNVPGCVRNSLSQCVTDLQRECSHPLILTFSNSKMVLELVVGAGDQAMSNARNVWYII